MILTDTKLLLSVRLQLPGLHEKLPISRKLGNAHFTIWFISDSRYTLLEHDIPILENKIFLLIFVHNKMSRKDKDIALFVAFCIEEYGAAKGLTGGQVLDLFSQYGVIDYLSKCYEPLHTQGRRWLMDEIDEFIAIRKNKKA